MTCHRSSTINLKSKNLIYCFRILEKSSIYETISELKVTPKAFYHVSLIPKFGDVRISLSDDRAYIYAHELKFLRMPAIPFTIIRKLGSIVHSGSFTQ